MVLSRRFLCAAALGAVFALGLAGTALADSRAWVGSTGGDWKEGTNWNPNGVPAAADEVLISGAEVKITEAANAKSVELGQGATLSIEGTGKLTLAAGGALHASGDATVEVKVVDGLEFTAVTDIAVSPDKTLTLKRGSGTIKGAGDLTLTDKGTLVLATSVTTASDLKITDGGTLVVEADGDLPALTGTPAITAGSIVINKENFGNAAAGLTLTKGNLTLNKSMKPNLKKVVITSGDLVVAEGVKIGNGDDTAPNGEVDLKDKGHLVLNGNLTLLTVSVTLQHTSAALVSHRLKRS